MKTPQLPCPRLAAAIGVSEIYLKREDLDHFGSHKGRSIPFMIETYEKKQGLKNFVISSSGNAALAAIIMIQNHNENNPDNRLKLTVLVGKKISAEKFNHLSALAKGDLNITIIQTDRPKQEAFRMDKSGEAKFLRQSTDDLALVGYFELAKELAHIPNLRAVFIPTSSGTTAQALGEEFQKLKLPIQIHIVQTTACHPIASSFPLTENAVGLKTASPNDKTSIAGAIVDKIAHRKEKVLAAIMASHGGAWIADNEEIRTAMKITHENADDLKISTNSALAVAGLIKAVKNGWQWDGPVACLITGK
ncbi:MAG: PLP-dependent lyase/thiolase [Patescibacteria group bacterium]